MTYFMLVDSAGDIVPGHERKWHASPPASLNGKGWRWVADSPPVVARYQEARRVLPIPDNAAQVPYEIVDRWTLAEYRARLIAELDGAAEAARLRYITPGAGQALTYQRKEAEARDHVAGGAGPWPILEAEAAATGRTQADLATEIIAQADAWAGVAARIEALRAGAKAAIAAAPDHATAQAAVDGLVWPEPEAG